MSPSHTVLLPGFKDAMDEGVLEGTGVEAMTADGCCDGISAGGGRRASCGRFKIAE